jgi:hypothetical protein
LGTPSSGSEAADAPAVIDVLLLPGAVGAATHALSYSALGWSVIGREVEGGVERLSSYVLS